MGHWSVYCGISNITITMGQEIVILPIRKNESYNVYTSYVPASLPIFGTYDDYGGIEDIERTKGVEMLEKHFNCKIEDITYILTRGVICNEKDFNKSLIENEEFKTWKFMFIDRKVYDFLSTYVNSYDKGSLKFGKKKILEFLGFEYVGENVSKETGNPTYDPNRYKFQWKFGEDSNFFTDGSYLHYKNNGIYYWDRPHQRNSGSCLSTYIDLPEDKLKYMELNNVLSWKLKEKNDAIEMFSWTFGVSSSFMHQITMREMLLGILGMEEHAAKYKIMEQDFVYQHLLMNIEEYGDDVAHLANLSINIRSFSGDFMPHVPHLTPQDGDRDNALVIRNKFAEIEQSYIHPYDEDDDE